MTARPPVPPFTEDTARQKVRAAEDAWNERNSGQGGARLYNGQPGGPTARYGGLTQKGVGKCIEWRALTNPP